ncbi:SAM-dependent methyltransferase [Amycolatopsis suaedae]|uniref:Class I SAM-dependent methyltransferase n=1 Tax=Amycolatopsis suaedae TaxID=2510978 RepID=A0A4Q7JF51_9PSEU|nr:class I SAM-dependent methyltransferase [Amycolatopsis suaedae]RZQ65826.1 class I SAM-dependent methyltransferase [Amycolatopsis suaedae]
MTRSDWYVDFFTELPNEFWRRIIPAESTVDEVDFVERRLGLSPGDRVVDVPCGSGRHAVELAARGYRVTGVDISAEAIEHARGAARAAGVEADLLVGDMRDIPRDGGFDAAVCLGNSFGYLDLAGTRELASALAGAVRPGGGLVVDYGAAAESVLPGFAAEARTMEAGDIVADVTTEYEVAASRLLSTYRFRRGDDELTAVAPHHVYTCAQVGAVLSDAGFTAIDLYGSTGATPFRVGDRRLLLTARRSG